MASRRALSFKACSLKDIQKENAKITLTNHRALVVGGTSGIGESMAKRLAKADVEVTIVGRDQKRGEGIVQELSALSTTTKSHQFIACDTSLMSNIQQCCEHYQQGKSSLDMLIMSQGIGSMNGRTETKEGIDQKLALHYFGRMAFIHHLLPLLRESKHQGKVMSVFSGGVNKANSWQLTKDDFELKNNFTLTNAATAAGHYNDLCLEEFSKDPTNQHLLFVHSAPGFVKTRVGSDLPPLLRTGVRLMQHLAKSSEDCAEFLCHPLFHTKQTGFIHVYEHGDIHQNFKATNAEEGPFVFEQTMKLITQHQR